MNPEAINNETEYHLAWTETAIERTPIVSGIVLSISLYSLWVRVDDEEQK